MVIPCRASARNEDDDNDGGGGDEFRDTLFILAMFCGLNWVEAPKTTIQVSQTHCQFQILILSSSNGESNPDRMIYKRIHFGTRIPRLVRRFERANGPS